MTFKEAKQLVINEYSILCGSDMSIKTDVSQTLITGVKLGRISSKEAALKVYAYYVGICNESFAKQV